MKPAVIVIAHNIRSTHNIGALLRTCDGLGVNFALFSANATKVGQELPSAGNVAAFSAFAPRLTISSTPAPFGRGGVTTSKVSSRPRGFA